MKWCTEVQLKPFTTFKGYFKLMRNFYQIYKSLAQKMHDIFARILNFILLSKTAFLQISENFIRKTPTYFVTEKFAFHFLSIPLIMLIIPIMLQLNTCNGTCNESVSYTHLDMLSAVRRSYSQPLGRSYLRVKKKKEGVLMC